MINKRRFFITFSVIALLASAQVFPQSGQLESNLKKHIEYLASDKLEGRLAGSAGEKLAGAYISDQFKQIGLKPAGENGSFFQSFTFNTGFEYGKKNSLKIGKKKFELGKDYYVLPYSSNVEKLEGEIVDVRFGISERPMDRLNSEALFDYGFSKGYPEGKIFLMNLGFPDRNPHGKYAEYDWAERLKIAKKYKPAAIVFYNSPEPLTIEAFKKFNNLRQEDIPLIYLNDSLAEDLLEAYRNYGLEDKYSVFYTRVKQNRPKTGELTGLEDQKIIATLSVELKRKEVSGRNVAGLIDNNKPNTIVIGAHYDHLGHGEYGNSLAPTSHDVHNGADDNASGTAMLIELARMVKNDASLNNYNFLFLAFSGEEEGLLGSNFFTKHPTISIPQMDCMFNMDMVGRLDSMKQELGVIGTGTSPSWPNLMAAVKTDLKIKTTESGMSASDNTSFYIQNVPALHFFTGSHPDYHKPSDDANKINYAGMVKVADYIRQMIFQVDDQEKLTFQKTKEDTATTPKFKVTFGIIPDYFFEGPGLRADGISPGKTAERAGMKAGDIILQVGEYEIKDMRSYMEMLGKFEKGQKTQVKIKRGEEILTLPVQF
jgi:hypothetical protein